MSQPQDSGPATIGVAVLSAPLVGAAWLALLERSECLRGRGVYPDAAALLAACRHDPAHAQVVLVDAAAADTVAIVHRLREGGCGWPLVALVTAADEEAMGAAIRAGALGVVDRRDEPARLFKALEKVAQGELWLDRLTAGRLFVSLVRWHAGAAPEAETPQQRWAQLTGRERRIIEELVRSPGVPVKVIARRLLISDSTLRNHLTQIYAKLGVPGRVALQDSVVRHGLIPVPGAAAVTAAGW